VNPRIPVLAVALVAFGALAVLVLPSAATSVSGTPSGKKLAFSHHSAAAASSSAAAPLSQNVRLVGRTGGSTYAVDPYGDLAYIGVGAEFTIIEPSNPPAKISGWPLLDIIRDILDPVGPREGGSAPLPGGAAAERVYVRGTYAYVASGVSGMDVLNVRNPLSPEWLDRIAISGGAWAVAGGETGDYVYVAGGNGRSHRGGRQ